MRTTMPKRGDIWLLRFPFTDLSSSKVRPAIIISVHGEDLIVLGIFSRLPSGTARDTWVIVDKSSPDFAQTGLMKTSLIKAEKIAVIHESILRRKLGRLPKTLMDKVDVALKKALELN